MIGFRVYNEHRSLVLYPSSAIKVVRKSPFFQDQSEAPVRTYSFTVPATENQEFFKYANLLDIRGGVYIYEARVDIKGSFAGKGLLFVESFNDVSYTVKTVVGRGASALSLDKSIREFKYLRETPYRFRLAAGVPTLPYKEYGLSFASGLPMAGDPVAILIDVYSSHLCEVVNFRVEYTPPTSLSEFLDAVVAAINEETSIHCIKAIRNTSSTIQFWNLAANDQYPEMGFVPETLDWYSYFNDFVNTSSNHPDPVLQELTHANDTINTDDYDYIFYPVYADFLSLTGIDFKQVINHYYPANVPPGPAINGIDGTVPTDWVKDNVLQPYPFIWKILQQICEELELDIVNEFFDDELKTLTYYIPLFNNLFNDGIIGGLTTRSFMYSSILPDIKFGQFLDELKKLFGMLTVFDSRNDRVRLYSRKQVFESPDIEDWTAYLVHEYTGKRDTVNLCYKSTWPESESLTEGLVSQLTRLKRLEAVLDVADLGDANFNYYRLVSNINMLYRKAGDFISSTWVEYAEGLEDYTPEGSQEEIQAETSTLFTHRGENVYTQSGKIVKWMIPHTRQTIVRSDEQKDSIRPQMLFYRGLQYCQVQEGDSPATLVARTYPMASYHNYDLAKTKIGNYCLAWNNPDGLIPVWHQDYINLRANSSPVTLRFNLPDDKLANLDMLKKIRAGNQVYILDEVEEDTTTTNPITIVKAWPIKTSFNG